MDDVKLSGNHTAYYPHSGFIYAANKKSLVGGKPWEDLSNAASLIIKDVIAEYDAKAQAKQIIFSLVGEDFVAKHYDLNTEYQPHLLEVPYMLPDVRVALEQEFTSILCEAITTASSDPEHPMNQSEEYHAYRTMVSRVYGSAMAEENRLMAATAFKASDLASHRRHGSKRSSTRSEGEIGGGSGRSSSELLTMAVSTLILGNGFAIDDNEVKKNMRHHSLTGKEGSGNTGISEESKDAKQKKTSGEKKTSTVNAVLQSSKRGRDDPAAEKNSALSEQESRVAPTHSHHSDLLAYIDGTSLVTDKLRWAETFKKESRVMLKLVIGRSCPVALRRFMFKWRIFNPEHVALTSTVIRRNMAIDKLTDPTISTIDNLLARATSQTFVDSLRDFDTPRLRGHVLALLNQYYTYSGSQHPSHVALAVPLLAAFSNQPKEGPYVVSMFHLMLEMLPGGGPSRRDALIIARRIVDTLADKEPELFLHLSELVNRARHYQQTLDFGKTTEFTELAVFVKPWVENLLVGYVRRDAVLFIWDQCFLTGWENNFEKFCMDVFQITKRKLLEIKSAPELKRAMVTLPGRIHTRNLREAFARRTKQYPEDFKLDTYWSTPPLKVLTKEVTHDADLERIEKLLSITGGADELRRHADLEARKNDIETKRDTKEMALCCQRGLLSKASKLLEDINIEVNDMTEDGQTFLYIAAEYSHLNIIQLLLDNDANPNLGEEHTGVTPLMAAVIGANSIQNGMKRKRPDETAAVMLALCNAGADVNAKAKRTLLRPSNMVDDMERERQIGRGVTRRNQTTGNAGGGAGGGGGDTKAGDRDSEGKRKEDDVLTLVSRGSTALHISVACACLKRTRYYCHPQLIMILLTCGANPNIINVQERTAKQIFLDANIDRKFANGLSSALMVSTKSGNNNGGGSSSNSNDSNSSNNASTFGIDKSLLRTAATLRAGVRTGQLSQVKRVLKSLDGDEASLNFVIHAVGGLQKMDSLLEKSRAVNFHKEERGKVEYNEVTAELDLHNACPLALAAMQGYKDVVEALESAGASLNIGMPGSVTPIMQSFKGANSKTNPTGKDGAGWELCRDTAQWLFENGADVLCRSCDTGSTSLHQCAASGLELSLSNLKASIPMNDDNQPIQGITTTTPDWQGNIPDNLIATFLGKSPPIVVPNAYGDPLVKQGEHLDDFVEDVAEEVNADPYQDQLSVIITDVPETEGLTLYIPTAEIVKDVDQLVGIRTLVLEHIENYQKLKNLILAIQKRHPNSDERTAKTEVTDAIDQALIQKMKGSSMRDDRNVPRLKARVKNKDGDPVVVKIRALMPGDSPKLAELLAATTVKRKHLPKKAIKKLTKHVLAFSTKKTNYSAKENEKNDGVMEKKQKKKKKKKIVEETGKKDDDEEEDSKNLSFTMTAPDSGDMDDFTMNEEKDDKNLKETDGKEIEKKQEAKVKEEEEVKKEEVKKEEVKKEEVKKEEVKKEEVKKEEVKKEEVKEEAVKEVDAAKETKAAKETNTNESNENKVDEDATENEEEMYKKKVKSVTAELRKKAIQSVGKNQWKGMTWKERYNTLQASNEKKDDAE